MLDPTKIIFFIAAGVLTYYFMAVRPKIAAQKKVAAELERMGNTDVVLTKGGLVGVVVELTTDRVQLEVSKGYTVTVLREYIARVIEKGAPSAAQA